MCSFRNNQQGTPPLLICHTPDLTITLLKLTENLIKQFFASKKIRSRVIAPSEALVLSYADKAKYYETLLALLESLPPDVEIVIFEANLGFPGEEVLNKDTLNLLQFLITKYSTAFFFLKSATEQAVTNAEEVLKHKGIPPERIISSDAIKVFSDEMREILLNTFTKEIGDDSNPPSPQ